MRDEEAESITAAARGIGDPARRSEFIAKACRGDAELRTQVERRLGATAGGDEDAFYFDDGGLDGQPGDLIDRYRLVRPLGQGGFGVVWLADQLEPVKRAVALKVIKLGMDTRQVVARFEQERQALALMDHPNIARVLDAGATATGRPYFVMDLVAGEPITDFCDSRRLTIEERLTLFDQVCAAVQHAHVKGIIHRDLKPSNILVSEVDGQARATVIDFGIAKATGSKLTDGTFATMEGQVIGTMLYMSPEQAAGSVDVDTRTDVYALGVILYELLTGRSPFDVPTIKRAMFAEVQRVICEVEPMRPSTALSSAGDLLTDVAAQRGVEATRLRSLVRGDLDWIVMKSLEKDRTRRYETADGLRMDVARYLRGAAVLAAPPSRSYRLRKFVRRNRGAVTAAGAVVLALAVGMVGFAWQAGIARTERDRAIEAREAEALARARADELARAEAEQRRAAVANAKRADVINQFLMDTLGSADVRQLGREARVVQALDRASASVAASFAERPDEEAAARRILGRTYLSLGLLDEAEPHLRAALELREESEAAQGIDHARALHDLGLLEGNRGRLEAAIEAQARAVAISLDVGGPDDPATLSFQSDYANALAAAGRREEAEALFRDTIARSRRVRGDETADMQILLNSLAVLLHNEKRLDEAESFYRQAIDLGTRLLGTDHPDTLTARMNLASVLVSQGRRKDAEPLMAAAFGDIARVYGENHPKTASAAFTLGGLYRDLGRFQEARPLLESSLAIRQRNQAENSPDVTQAQTSLAGILVRLGEHERAIELERAAVAVVSAREGPESAEALKLRLDLANYLARANQDDEAESAFTQLLEVCPRVLGEDAPTTVIVTNSFAVFLLGKERYAEAEPLLRKALAAGRRTEGEDAANTIITQYNLVACLRELDRSEEAAELGADVIDRFVRVFGAGHPNVATVRLGQAGAYQKLGRFAEAEREIGAAITIFAGALGAANTTTLDARIKLARLLDDAGRFAEAEPVLRDILAADQEARPEPTTLTANARAELGRALVRLGRFPEAETLLLAGHALLAEKRPPGHRDLRRVLGYVAELYESWNAAEPTHERAEKAQEWRDRAGG